MNRTALGALIGVLAFVVALELLLRVLPVSSATRAGYHVDPKILTYAPHLDWRYATGWDLRNPQRLRTNGHGFVSEHEFIRDERAIALVGDSFVESASLPALERPAVQLELALGGRRPVYAMGAAGTALLDYAERIRWAHQQFGIRDFVVLMERADVRQALCGSGNVHSECLEPTTLIPLSAAVAPPSTLKRVLRESALAQYLTSQLKVTPEGLLRKVFVYQTPEIAAGPAAPARGRPAALPPLAVEMIAAEFFSRVKPYATGKLVIVIDSDRQTLMRGDTPDDPERALFIAAARAAGATVVDTTPLFRDHYQRSNQLSLDLGPQDGHFNAVGVRLVARAAARALQEDAR